MRAVCIDGAIVPPERAVVSVYDRGFLYGDGAFEVLRTYGGVPFAMDEHLARLARSAAALRMAMPAPPAVLADDVARALAAARAGDASDARDATHARDASEATHARDASEATHARDAREAYLRIMVTRGEPAPGAPLSLALDPHARPRRIVLVEPLRPIPPETYARGVRAITVVVPRARDTSAAKLLPYVTSMLALDDARARGASDALFVDPRGVLLEGATSNVFLVRGGRLVTPSERDPILAGVTRAHVLELARGLGIAIDEEAPPIDALTTADEAFLTSSLREVVPLVTVDDRAIGAGTPGPMTRALHDALRRRIAASRAPLTPE